MALVATKLKAIGTKPIMLTLSLVASGSYSTGGDALDLGPLAGFTTKQPDFVLVEGIAGYMYKYDSVAKTVLVYIPTAVSGNTGFAQHSAATYAAGVSGDTIKVLAIWLR